MNVSNFVRCLIIAVIGFIVLAYATQFVVLHIIPEEWFHDPDFDKKFAKIIGSISAVYMISASIWVFLSARNSDLRSTPPNTEQKGGKEKIGGKV